MGTVSGSGCTPIVGGQPDAQCCKPIVEPLNDKECANIILVQSVIRGDLTDVTRAIDMGANVNTTADLSLGMGPPGGKGSRRVLRVTPLMRAAALGHVDVIRKLVERGANISKRDSRNWSPLCYALGACELDAARQIFAEAGPEADSQLAVVQLANSQRTSVLKECEEALGADAAERVRRELDPPGFLSLPLQQAGAAAAGAAKQAGAAAAEEAETTDAIDANQVADAAKEVGDSAETPAPAQQAAAG